MNRAWFACGAALLAVTPFVSLACGGHSDSAPGADGGTGMTTPDGSSGAADTSVVGPLPDAGSGSDAGSADSSVASDANEPDGESAFDGGDAESKDAAPCNPAAYPFPGATGANACPVTAPCDTTLTATGPASDFAKALGVCATSLDAAHWGLVSATYANGHTTPAAADAGAAGDAGDDAGVPAFAAQHGILPKFGSALAPREGAMLGVLSSGSATVEDTDTGPFFKGTKNGMQGPQPILPTGGNSGDVPPGFPQASPGCAAPVATVNDVIDVKLQIRVPVNAGGFSFDFDFISSDWPEYVCSQFNDGFVAYLQSQAFKAGAGGNVSFDSSGNAITVNSSFVQACTAGTEVGCQGGDAGTGVSVCSLGPDSLTGTGFGAATPAVPYCGTTPSVSGGGSGWLTTAAPAQPGEVMTLEFIIWDTGDVSWDSSVLLDHFQWLPAAGATPTTAPSPP